MGDKMTTTELLKSHRARNGIAPGLKVAKATHAPKYRGGPCRNMSCNSDVKYTGTNKCVRCEELIIERLADQQRRDNEVLAATLSKKQEAMKLAKQRYEEIQEQKSIDELTGL